MIVVRGIRIYTKKNGVKPFWKWINGLDNATRLRIKKRIERCVKGNLGDYKRLKNGIFELRMPFGAGYRVYFIEHDGYLLILCGGNKGSQQKDIEEAIKYRNECEKDWYHEN